jgi:hypothetical protein
VTSPTWRSVGRWPIQEAGERSSRRSADLRAVPFKRPIYIERTRAVEGPSQANSLVALRTDITIILPLPLPITIPIIIPMIMFIIIIFFVMMIIDVVLIMKMSAFLSRGVRRS